MFIPLAPSLPAPDSWFSDLSLLIQLLHCPGDCPLIFLFSLDHKDNNSVRCLITWVPSLSYPSYDFQSWQTVWPDFSAIALRISEYRFIFQKRSSWPIIPCFRKCLWFSWEKIRSLIRLSQASKCWHLSVFPTLLPRLLPVKVLLDWTSCSSFVFYFSSSKTLLL